MAVVWAVVAPAPAKAEKMAAAAGALEEKGGLTAGSKVAESWGGAREGAAVV